MDIKIQTVNSNYNDLNHRWLFTTTHLTRIYDISVKKTKILPTFDNFVFYNKPF